MKLSTYCTQTSVAAIFAAVFGVLAFMGGVTAFVVMHPSTAPAETAAMHFPAPFTVADSALAARAAIVYDPTNGRVLYEKNAGLPLPLASITKLMTAQVALASIPSTTPVTITSADILHQGDWGLRPGDTLSLYALLKLGLVASANDAMAAVATSLGSTYLAQMNQTATSIGLTQTRFLNPTGLDISTTTAGAYSSAHDVALLAATFYAQHPEYFTLTQASKVRIVDGSRTLAAAATALPLLDIPGLVGAKTGYTDLAGGNLVAIFDVEIGHPLVAVVLGSTEEGRFADIRTLINTARTSTP